MEKMAIINTFGPVSINGRCIGYMLAYHSWMNLTGSVLLSNVYLSLNFKVTVVA